MEVQPDCPSAAHLTAPPTAPADSAPVDSDVAATVKQDVLSILLDNSEPAPPPKAWPFIEPTDDIRHLTLGPYALGPHALGVELKRRFTERQIVAAGKVAGEPLLKRLSQLFAGADRKFICFRGGDQRCLGICSEHGHLWLEEPPALNPALRRVDAMSNTGTVPLLLPETVDDLQVLRGLGFDAELSFSLHRLKFAAIEQVFAPLVPDESWMHHLLIVDWNVCGVNYSDRPRAMAILKRLSLTQETYGHDPGSRFSRWIPNSVTRAAIKNARDFRDAQRVRDLIRSSFPNQQLGTPWRYHIKTVAITYHATRTKLQNLLTQTTEIPPVAKVKLALEEFRTVSQSQVTAQLYAKADRTESPVVRAMIHHVTELHERWFETQAIVQAAKKMIAGNHPGADWQLNADDLKERIVLIGKLFAMLTKLHAMN
jgi:hypothetical protein